MGLRPDVLRVIPPATPLDAAAELERIGLAILKTDPPVAGHAHEPRRRLLAEAAIGLRVRLRRMEVARRRDRNAFGDDEARDILANDRATFIANGLPCAPCPDGLSPFLQLGAWTGATRSAIEAELDKLPAPTTAEIIKAVKAAIPEVGHEDAVRRLLGEVFYEPPATYYGGPSEDEKKANPKAVDHYPKTDDSYVNWTDSPAKLWAFVKVIRRDVTARWDPAKAVELLRVWKTARGRAEALGLAVPDDTDDARTAFDRLARLALDIENGPTTPAPVPPAATGGNADDAVLLPMREALRAAGVEHTSAARVRIEAARQNNGRRDVDWTGTHRKTGKSVTYRYRVGWLREVFKPK